jgi:hypothetical protein
MTSGAMLDGFVPIRTYWLGGEPRIDWCHLGATRFREPFFDETIGLEIRKPFNQLFRPQTTLAELEAWLAGHPPVPPTGFVFHMSRCGSTLISQMLAASPRNVSISEALPIDTALRPDLGPPDVGDDLRIRLLRGVVAALGQRRLGGESRYFVKFDCWHSLLLGLIRQAFPEVPWLFLYREPTEVLVSQLRRRGVQTVPGMIRPELFGIDFAAAVQMPAADYCALVLAAICRAAVEPCRAGGGLLVNYGELPEALLAKIPDHFGVEWTAAERAAMAEATKFDSKAPSFEFIPDLADKRQAVSEPVRAAAERELMPVYRDLEALRLAGRPSRRDSSAPTPVEGFAQY